MFKIGGFSAKLIYIKFVYTLYLILQSTAVFLLGTIDHRTGCYLQGLKLVDWVPHNLYHRVLAAVRGRYKFSSWCGWFQ